MSHRAGIIQALVAKMRSDIVGAPNYRTNLDGLVDTKIKFHDELAEFPYVSISAGLETREDHPSHFSWGHLNATIRIFVRNEDASEEELENIISDIENFIEFNRELPYTAEVMTSGGLVTNNYETTDITIGTIQTDEGLLAPDGIGEITIQIRYQILRR